MIKRALSLMLTATLLGLVTLCTPARGDNKEKDEDRLRNSGQVLKEILNIPDDIPQSLMDKADCVVVIPTVIKAAFIVGGSYGRGAMTCRSGDNMQGPWGAPTMMALEGGSFGFQIGVSDTDVVMLVTNENGVKKLLSNKFTLGADASVAAGPIGRDSSAETDAQMHAEILTYSRSRGVFAGISLQGATLRPDDDWNKELYGKAMSNRDIVLDNVPPPASASKLIAVLDKYSSRK